MMNASATVASNNIIFGSCNSQHYEHPPFWDVIQSRKPTSFVWAGDAVYGDEQPDGSKLEATPDVLRQLFQELKDTAGYKSIIESGVNIFGTIDDHDYGVNNGDKTFRWRKENAIEYVKFLDLPDDSPMMKRANAGLGVYGVQVYDFSESDPKQRLLSDEAAGLDPDVVRHVDSSKTKDDDLQHHNRRVAVFVLDVRSNRTPWPKTLAEKLFNDKEGCFLGEEQFRWFETAIGRSNAAVNIVVTGLQVHPDRFYDSEEIEGWVGFPKSQHRLYQALLQPNVRAPIILSGDVHHAQLLRKDCRQLGSNALRPLYEVTTSGMTHSWGADDVSMCGKSLSSPLCNFAKRVAMKFVYRVFPFHELIVDETTGQMQNTLDLNIAELEFDWEQQQVIVQILGQEGQKMLEQRWAFGNLTGIDETKVSNRDFQSLPRQWKSSDSRMLEQDDSWVCVHYGGTPGSVSFALATVATASFVFVLFAAPFLLMSALVIWLIYRKMKKRRSLSF